jgi:putative endonuclease
MSLSRPRDRRTSGVIERRRRVSAGQRSELLAELLLRLKGYRILARRWRSPSGEIDLVAVRGRCVVFVEVKRRPSDAAAEAAVGDRQRNRVRRAAALWLAANPRLQAYEQRFDLVLVVPRRLPRHIVAGL